MALPKVASGTKLLIKVGDGQATETFDTTLTCALMTKAVNFTADANTIVVPDCDNPDLPAANQTEITATGLEITGSGVVKTDSVEAWHTWFASGAAKNVRAEIGIAAADGGGYWQAAMKLTAFSVTGERGNKLQMEVTLQADGAVTWTDAPA
jgi:predicted secreted protein